MAAEMTARGHEVSVSISPPGSRDRDQLDQDDRDTRWAGSPPALPAPWRTFARRIRYAIDYLHYLQTAHAVSVTWRSRARRFAMPRGLGRLAPIDSLSGPALRRTMAAFVAMERASETPAVFDAFLTAQAPDLLVVAPLVHTPMEQDDLIKSASRLGVPSAMVVPTWDTFVNKGRMRIHPDALIVWNDSHRRQAIELHGVAPSKVVVCGAPMFDRWLDAGPPTGRDAFFRRIGLPSDRPLILFLGSNTSIARPEDELEFVRRWLETLRRAQSPLVREAAVLIRPYPTATHWAHVDLSALGPVSVGGAGWPTLDAAARDDLDDALLHATAVVGINTSAMIDAAMAGRPVLSVLCPEFSGGQAGSIHFDDLRPEHGGCLLLARTLDEHVLQLAEALQTPGRFLPQLAAFNAWFARPRDATSPATPMVATALEQVAARGPVAEHSARRRWLRWVLWPMAVALTGASMMKNAQSRIRR